MRLKRKVPFFHQNDQSNCGAACIKMVSEYYWKSVDYRTIKQSATKGKGRAGSADMMETIRKKVKLKCKEITGDNDIERLIQIKKAIEMERPVILFCKVEAKYEHYVVVTGIDIDDMCKGNLEVNDPYFKPFPVKLKYFLKKENKSRKYEQSLSWAPKGWGIEVYEP